MRILLGLALSALSVSGCKTDPVASKTLEDPIAPSAKYSLFCQGIGDNAVAVFGNLKSRVIFRSRFNGAETLQQSYLVMVDLKSRSDIPRLGSSTKAAVNGELVGEEMTYGLRRKNNSPCDYEFVGQLQLPAAGERQSETFAAHINSACTHTNVVKKSFKLTCQTQQIGGAVEPVADMKAVFEGIAGKAQVANGSAGVDKAENLATQEALNDAADDDIWCGPEAEAGDGGVTKGTTISDSLTLIDEMAEQWDLAEQEDDFAMVMRKLNSSGKIKALAVVTGSHGLRTCWVTKIIALSKDGWLLTAEYDFSD